MSPRAGPTLGAGNSIPGSTSGTRRGARGCLTRPGDPRTGAPLSAYTSSLISTEETENTQVYWRLKLFNKKYLTSLVRIETSEFYDSFLLQARGRDQADGNATLVGEFVRAPQICRYLDCLSKEDSRF